MTIPAIAICCHLKYMPKTYTIIEHKHLGTPSRKLKVARISLLLISIAYMEVVSKAWLEPTNNLDTQTDHIFVEKIAMIQPMKYGMQVTINI